MIQITEGREGRAKFSKYTEVVCLECIKVFNVSLNLKKNPIKTEVFLMDKISYYLYFIGSNHLNNNIIIIICVWNI